MKRKRKRSKAHTSRKLAPQSQSQSAIPVETPMTLTWGDPDSCTCPVCAHLAMEGRPHMVMGPDGQAQEVVPELPEMMSVSYRATGTVAAYLGNRKKTLPIPVGCKVRDFLEYLLFVHMGLQREFSVLQASCEGEALKRNEILQPGQMIHIDGTRDGGRLPRFIGTFS